MRLRWYICSASATLAVIPSARVRIAVLDRHCRALRQIGQHGVHGIAQHGRPARAPVADRRTVVQRPAEALVAVRLVDDELDVGMPAAEVGLEVLPREPGGPGFLRDLIGL